MRIKIGQYELENETECKIIPDGIEIFADAVTSHNINPEEIDGCSAYWGMYESIIVEL